MALVLFLVLAAPALRRQAVGSEGNTDRDVIASDVIGDLVYVVAADRAGDGTQCVAVELAGEEASRTCAGAAAEDGLDATVVTDVDVDGAWFLTGAVTDEARLVRATLADGEQVVTRAGPIGYVPAFFAFVFDADAEVVGLEAIGAGDAVLDARAERYRGGQG